MSTLAILEQIDSIKRVLELAPLGAFQTDLQGNCLYVNKEWETISGRNMHDLLGHKWLKMVMEEDLPMVLSVLRNRVSRQNEVTDFTFRITHPKKGIRYCKTNAKFIFNSDGKPLYFIGYTEDITIQKHKTEFIHLQNQLLSALKKVQDQFYLSETPTQLFTGLLNEILQITQSKLGFIVEINDTEDKNFRSLTKLACSDAGWVEGNASAATHNQGKVFVHLYSHYLKLLKNSKPYIVNNANEIDDKNKNIHSFIILPAIINGKLVGMIGLANRVGGYRQAKIQFLKPLLSTFANLIAFHRVNLEKRIAENKQLALTSHLETLITSLEDIIFELDGNKVFQNVWVNNEEILFLPKAEFIGKTISEVFGPTSEIFNRPVEKALLLEEVVEFEYKHIDVLVDKWYNAKITPLKKSGKEAVTRLVMSVRDITPKKKQDLAIREAKDKLERLNFLLDVTQEIGKVGGWEYFVESKNVSFTKQSFVLYELPSDFVPTIENTLRFFDRKGKAAIDNASTRALREKMSYRLELPVVTAQGNKKWVRIIGIPLILNQEVVGLRGATIDITEEKEVQLDLIRIKEKLELSNGEKDRIMQVLAHDLRSPLSGIYTMAGLLLDKNRFSERNSQMLQLINDSSLSAYEMVGDLIDSISDNSTHTMKLAKENLVSVLQRCIHLLKFRAAEKRQKIHLKNSGAVFSCIDTPKLERVMNNLINNAIKFSPKNSGIVVEVKEKETFLQISVADEGIGIPAELQDKVFDAFTKGKRYGTSGERPFGLGLSICRQIVEAHKGTIWFESETGKGTIFYVQLPKKECG